MCPQTNMLLGMLNNTYTKILNCNTSLNLHFISDRSDTSVRFAYRKKTRMWPRHFYTLQIFSYGRCVCWLYINGRKRLLLPCSEWGNSDLDRGRGSLPEYESQIASDQLGNRPGKNVDNLINQIGQIRHDRVFRNCFHWIQRNQWQNCCTRTCYLLYKKPALYISATGTLVTEIFNWHYFMLCLFHAL